MEIITLTIEWFVTNHKSLNLSQECDSYMPNLNQSKKSDIFYVNRKQQ